MTLIGQSANPAVWELATIYVWLDNLVAYLLCYAGFVLAPICFFFAAPSPAKSKWSKPLLAAGVLLLLAELVIRMLPEVFFF